MNMRSQSGIILACVLSSVFSFNLDAGKITGFVKSSAKKQDRTKRRRGQVSFTPQAHSECVRIKCITDETGNLCLAKNKAIIATAEQVEINLKNARPTLLFNRMFNFLSTFMSLSEETLLNPITIELLDSAGPQLTALSTKKNGGTSAVKIVGDLTRSGKLDDETYLLIKQLQRLVSMRSTFLSSSSYGNHSSEDAALSPKLEIRLEANLKKLHGFTFCEWLDNLEAKQRARGNTDSLAALLSGMAL